MGNWHFRKNKLTAAAAAEPVCSLIEPFDVGINWLYKYVLFNCFRILSSQHYDKRKIYFHFPSLFSLTATSTDTPNRANV